MTLLGLALILPLVLLAAYPAQAHGGGTPQLTNAEAGPYLVSVWTQPDPIRVGTVHITVAVAEPPRTGVTQREAGDLVLDATVRVQFEPVGLAGEKLVALATRQNALNKLFYEADLELATQGRWRVSIGVHGPAGAGAAAFDIEALPPSPLSTLQALRWPLWGGIGLALLAAGWFVRTFRAGNDRRPTAQATVHGSARRSAAGRKGV